MTKTHCRQRSDLMNYKIPCVVKGKHQYIKIHDWHYCEQPDELNDEEFNVKVAFNNQTYYVSSIDLEFKDKEVKI